MTHMIIDSHQHLMLPTELQLQKMNEANIDKAILFCTAPHPEKANTMDELKLEMNSLSKILNGASSKEESIQRLSNNITILVGTLKKYPKQFLGFGSVPLGLSTKETTEWMDRYIFSNGLKGIGEFTPGTEEQMEQLDSVFEALSQFVPSPVWVHTFHPVSMNSIKILMHLCKRYPTIPVIFGHLGGYHWMDVIDIAKSVPNVYLDLSATYSTIASRMAIRELPERCLFSSDAPYGEPLLYRQMIEYVSDSPSIAQMVLGENIMGLLHLT